MALSKYRTFSASNSIDWTIGNLSGVASNPQTLVTVVRKVSGGVDAEIAQSPGFDPLDWFYINGGTTIAFNNSVDFANGPSFINSEWCLYAFRSRVAASSQWSKSVWSGAAWPTPTHTTSTTQSARNYGGVGPITIGTSGATMTFDMVCMARFDTNLSDAQINAMTAGVDAIKATANITNLWYVGQASPADLVGTTTATVTGTTLSGSDSPFEGPATVASLIDPPLLVTASAVSRSYSW